MANDESEIDRAFLTRIPIFAGLPDRVMDLIAGTLRVVHVVPGAQLLREGEHARSMFVVRDGELQIMKHGKGGAEYKLAVLKAGDVVGEMSLIDIQPRSATARAIGTATVYVLDIAEIGKLYSSDVEAYALLVLNISREISRRLRLADEVLANLGMTAEAMWSDAIGTTTHPAMPVVTD
jgi:CRP/FNR family transcriptional regulator, cyclic AMP receptor protein